MSADINTRDTPPPPSPSASEPPPSYDSLTPRPPTSGLLVARRHGDDQVLEGTEEVDTAATGGGDDDDDDDDDPPPPYSPGVRSGTRSNGDVYEGADAPPSYHSLFGQIQEAHRQSPNSITFLEKLGRIILNTVGCTVLLMVFMSIPFTVLVLGIVYLKECPLQPLIPVFLILGGISGVLKNISLVIESFVKRSPSLSSRVKHPNRLLCTWKIVNLLFNLFMLIWIVAGSYWVYSVYTQAASTDYGTCNEVLYKFSFAIVTLSYILLLLMCFLAGICVWKKSKNNSIREGRGHNREEGCGRDGGENCAHDRVERGEENEAEERGSVEDSDDVNVGEGNSNLEDVIPNITLTRAHSSIGVTSSEGVATEQHSHNGGMSHSMEILTDRNRDIRHNHDGIRLNLSQSQDFAPPPRTDHGINPPCCLGTSQVVVMTSTDSAGHHHPKEFRNAISCNSNLPALSLQGQSPLQVVDHSHSIPALNESNSFNLHVRPREFYRSPHGEEDMGGASTRSSLYSTMHSDGFSITAV